MKLFRSLLAVVVAALLVCAITPDVGWAEEEPEVISEAVPMVEAETVETEVEVPGNAGVEAAPEPVWFGNVQLWEIVAAIVAFAWGIAKTKMKLDEDWQKRIVGFFEAGAQLTYDELVREAKKASADGKLTREQIDAARGRAWEAAKRFAADQGIDLARQIAVEQVPVLLSRVIGGLKGKAK